MNLGVEFESNVDSQHLWEPKKANRKSWFYLKQAGVVGADESHQESTLMAIGRQAGGERDSDS